ncbi:HisA/HisF-related TIM barrel protein [Sphingomonas daechungensis]|uniref:1-(5-phosphoribosyl)-5-[(5- phosphoribosylamino)methylideneamino]imidazole-4- carboxamide isomerase n=1 Tax=Sphingomonas daechungensis TaxID=1176646 RepID=UPI00378407D9
MIIYPAMDLIGGRAVRLQQGRFDDVTAYSTEPLEALRGFAAAGASWAHVVDLDGAKAGNPVQRELVAELARETPLKLQVAGGYRERGQLVRMFDAGVSRIVIGSLAVREPDAVGAWLKEFGPDRITLSLDIRLTEGSPRVAVAGWTEDTGRSLWDVAAQFPNVRHLLVTDIGRDGMLQGPNFALYQEIARRLPGVAVQASGGISSLDDLEQLPTDGAIIGKALWEKRISLEEALGLARA